MRYRFHTLSAAFYIIDTDEMTWERHTPEAKTPELVLGLNVTKGALSDDPIIRIGRRCIIPIWEETSLHGVRIANTIHTTSVQQIELLDEDSD